MAEYLPLLERAVAGLADSTPETRRAIYERARAALIGHLRGMDPPVPEEDVARENTALDDAISRMEASFRVPEAPPPAPIEVVTPPAPPARPRAPVLAPRAPLPPRPPGLPSAQAPTVESPPPRERPLLAPRAPAATRPPGGALTQRPAAPSRMSAENAGETPPVPAAAPRPSLSARPLNTAPRVGIEPRTVGPVREPPPVVAEAASPKPADPPTPLPAATPLDVARPVRAERTKVETATADERTPEAALSPLPPPEGRTYGAAFYLALAVGALVVGGVAFEAWKLRDRADQVMAAQQRAAADAGGKVADRAGGQDDSTARPGDSSGDVTVVSPPVVAGGQPAAAPTARPPEAPQPAPTTAPMDTAPTPAPSATPAPDTSASVNPSPALSVDVAERAALLVAAPDDPQKIKTYDGTVIWKTESVSSGQGQPLSQAIVADVRIPGAKLTMSMVMKRNTEPQLLASHTIEFRFNDEPGNDIGPVKQIDVPQMRLDDSSPIGDPLTGLPVAITDNNFLVGLSRGGAEAANTLMLERRNWIDLPLFLASDKPAKITFEKGAPGQRIIEDAIKAWQSGG